VTRGMRLAVKRPDPTPLAERGRILFVPDVIALLEHKKSAWWVRNHFAPEYKHKLGRDRFWWEYQALPWLEHWRLHGPPRPRAEHTRAWRQRNREAVKGYAQRRRALLKGARRRAERFSPGEIYERDGWQCGICQQHVEPADATLDHIIPLSRGGPHTRANVQLAHRRCNSRKGAR